MQVTCSFRVIQSNKFISVKSCQLSKPSCPDLKCFLKPPGNKRQIFWTPILQLAENVIATMTRIQGFRLETRARVSGRLECMHPVHLTII